MRRTSDVARLDRAGATEETFRNAQALREGCVFATIVADRSTSAPILVKRGFTDLGPATYYLWPSSRF